MHCFFQIIAGLLYENKYGQILTRVGEGRHVSIWKGATTKTHYTCTVLRKCKDIHF